jgi:tetratricopeptide (TPR) repeat protein
MKLDINIYIITSDHLKLRFNNLNQQISKLKSIFDKKKINYTFHQINNPSSIDVEKNLDKYKEKVNLSKDDVEDSDFKNLITPVNTSQLSNFSKHLKAFELIKNSDSNYNFIIEDDIIIIDDFIDNFCKCLDEIQTIDYDLIFTGISINQEGDFKLLNSHNYFKVLIAKSSYFISKDCAVKLLEFMNKIRFNFKINLSYFIWSNKDTIKSYVCNKNILFEGSKIGLYPTSINNNNFLYQNGEYVKLTQLISDKEYIDDETIKKAEEIYNNSGKNNPDFQHTLGLAYFKNKDYKKAKEILIEAVKNIKKNDGFISQHSEILNNCINMHQFEQSDIENVLKLPGIYS